MNKILALAVLLLLSAPMVNAENVNYFGELNKLTGHLDDVSFVDWSPDGTQIVSSDWINGMNIWNVTDGTLLMNLTGHSDAVWTVKWSPDGMKIASASWDKTVRIWDSLTGEELAVYNHDSDLWGLDWSPDGMKILSGTQDGRAILWDVSTGNPIINLTNHTGTVATIAWSPDGTKIATGSWGNYLENTIFIWNASTYEIIGSYISVSNPIFYNPGVRSTDVLAFSWSPDSNRVAAGTDSGLTIINVLDGSRIETVIPDGAWGVSWSPDGTKIATSMDSSKIFIWDVNGNIIRELTGHGSGDWVQTVDWSPDGTKLASGASDNAVIIWGDLRNVIIQQQQNIISVQNETIQQQQNALNNISSDITRFEQDMQTTFNNPDFALVGSTPDEKINTLVDMLLQLSRGATNEIYKVLGYK